MSAKDDYVVWVFSMLNATIFLSRIWGVPWEKHDDMFLLFLDEAVRITKLAS